MSDTLNAPTAAPIAPVPPAPPEPVQYVDVQCATPEQWRWAAFHCGTDLLPSVGNPTAPKSPKIPAAESLSNIPSFMTSRGFAVRKKNWPEFNATAADVREWAGSPDHNILINARNIRVIDIDIDDHEAAAKIHRMAVTALGVGELPARWRTNKGRVSLFFRVEPNPILTRRGVDTPAGTIEFLGNGRQSLWAGRHHSGALLQHSHHENGFPVVSLDALTAFWDGLVDTFDPGAKYLLLDEDEQLRTYGSRNGGADASDAITAYLHNEGLVHSVEASGIINVRCPNAESHTTHNPNSTSYFAPGIGGHLTPGFKCLHSKGCEDLTLTDYLEHIGYSAEQRNTVFMQDLLPRPEEAAAQAIEHAKQQAMQQSATSFLLAAPKLDDAIDLAVANGRTLLRTLPRIEMAKNGQQIKPTISNLTEVLRRCEIFDTKYDDFRGETIIRIGGTGAYNPLTDNLVAAARLTIERITGVTFGHQEVSRALSLVSELNKFDSAQEWIKQQQWDGVPRIERFATDILKAEDSPYAKALGQYLFVAMAGRIISPGCKADISPVLLSQRQGTGKSSIVARLAPFSDWFGTVDLTNDDDDIYRAIKGKTSIELPELRGLFGRDASAIKALLTQQVDSWTPKFREFKVEVPRRCIFVGTDNRARFLSDATGNRRFAPIQIARTAKYIDWPTFEKHTAQYYAEAAHILGEYGTPGVGVGVFSAALDRLSLDYVIGATILDAWHETVGNFVAMQPPGSVVSLVAVFSHLFNAGVGAMDVARVNRLRNVMMMHKLEEVGSDKWRAPATNFVL